MSSSTKTSVVTANPKPKPSFGLADARNLTDLGNAQWFARWVGDQVRYDHTSKQWYIYDGMRWAEDKKGGIFPIAIATMEGLFAAALVLADERQRDQALRHALNSRQTKAIKAMLELARSLSPIAVSHDNWDQGVHLLNVQNGTLNLKTGRLLSHQPSRDITKLAAATYDPKALCPKWDHFLDTIFAGDPDLIQWVQRAVGLSLSGEVLEHVLFVCYGTGRNGKTIFLNVLQRLMGDYGQTADREFLLTRPNSEHPTGEASLVGARFVCSSETDSDRQFAAAKVKDLCGGARRKARFMHGNFFQYDPTDTFWLATNNKPTVKERSEGFWERVKLVPFSVYIPKEDQIPQETLMADLLGESAGILAWGLRGLAEVRLHKLGACRAVTTATGGYRAEEDELGAFFDERCILDPDAKVSAQELYRDYSSFCLLNGDKEMSGTKFGKALSERGFQRIKNYCVGRPGYQGIKLDI